MVFRDMFKYSQSDWVRYSDYEYRATPDGELYIVPTAAASINIYNPLQDIDNLLIDSLNIGRLLISENPDMPKIKLEILSYAKRYGLLGFMVSFPLSMDFLENKDVLLGKNMLTSEQTMKTKDYLNLFMPFEKMAVTSNSVSSENALPVTMFMDRPLVYEIAFGKLYGEKFEWMSKFFSELYTHFGAAFFYSKTDNMLEKSLHSSIVDAFKMYGLGFRIKMLDKPTLIWDFSSLKNTIETLYGFYLADADRPLRLCKHCGKIFISRNSKAEFCRIPCRNQFNVYKSRRK